MRAVSLEETIDTSSAAGELIFHVFGAIAHFERRLISEHTRDGIAAARAKGKLPGRQPLDSDKVSAALKLVAANVSPAEAARQLGIGRSTVYREMKRLGVARPARERNGENAGLLTGRFQDEIGDRPRSPTCPAFPKDRVSGLA